MLSPICHRGPDGEGVFCFENIGIGHRRLSIIDLVGGKQPLSNFEKSLWITYNGELYNYRELRKSLQQKGFSFSTDSDTEVVLHAYAYWGKDCVRHFRGMFAFGILDILNKELFLARDHFGIKPLVYAHNSEVFAFSSEIQALKPIPEINWDIDLTALDQYLAYQFIPAPNTIYKEVKKLPPAHFMRVSFSGEIKELTSYWQLDFKPDHSRTEKDWMEALEETIKISVNSHLVADVPFGSFLSGGIDSSLVVGYMSQLMAKPVKTFSIGFEEEGYSELDYARKVARHWGTDHHEAIVRADALSILPDLVRHYGEPFGDSSAIPTYYVSQLARKHVTMALSGDAGDELFAGYESYSTRWSRHFSPIPEHLPAYKKGLYQILNPVFPRKYPLRTASLSDWQRYIQYYGPIERSKLWKPEFSHQLIQTDAIHLKIWKESEALGHFQKAQNLDFRTYLPYDILTKVDIASMMHSLEVRTPLLDIRVVELACQIPEKFNINKSSGEWVGKQLLKKIVSKDLGNEFAFRNKMGFAIPIQKWFGTDGKSSKEVKDRLLSSGNGLDTFFDTSELKRIANGSHSGQQWLMIFLQEWLNQNKV
ncbi:asparagine synthase (glutamine-hydrolyzing) [Rhodonellum sp.]|uniref:asparagine synthase (glutamine-hydrolyzing) n=1 Tax=Rhodonellum sp. TaxID=2231180 RepID=UPI0027167F54|nr:asparagine synthase (glutamine-hydrolyzing) [Rhodonellum sp.]MDO9553105.1 asparagine synthase (glutamine-hydrolyzing) [Rhodonellum sp.]